jgi:hypothetical protein
VNLPSPKERHQAPLRTCDRDRTVATSNAAVGSILRDIVRNGSCVHCTSHAIMIRALKARTKFDPIHLVWT